jgi:CBS domain-containing protein
VTAEFTPNAEMLMNLATAFALVIAGIALMAGTLMLRVRSNSKYELKTGDFVMLIVPLLLFGIVTGRIKALDVGGVKADLSSLFERVGSANIGLQTSHAAPATVSDAVRTIETAQKAGLELLPELVKRQPEGLIFTVGRSGYWVPAIKAYLEAFAGSSALRYVILEGQDGKLIGVFRAPDLVGYLRILGDRGYAEFDRLISENTPQTHVGLAHLPGFMPVESAVASTTTKIEALRRMDQLRVDSLPVVGPDGRFAGIVERGALTTSLLVAVSDELTKH